MVNKSQPNPPACLSCFTLSTEQADIVLLSFVRANMQRRLGFLTEFRRLNVALTRAKRSLIVPADAISRRVRIQVLTFIIYISMFFLEQVEYMVCIHQSV